MVWLRPAALFAVAFVAISTARAADPLAGAMLEARDLLVANRPAAAVVLLEQYLPTADGSRAFLDLLKTAYVAEMPSAEPARVAELRTKLALFGGAPVAAPTPVAPAVPAPIPAPEPPSAAIEALSKATAVFNQARSQPSLFPDAAKLFAAAFLGRVEMSPDQLTAWAYCRIKVAADRLNKAGPTDAATSTEVLVEIEEALALAPGNAGLQKVGRDLIAAARQRGGVASPPRPSPVAQLRPLSAPSLSIDAVDVVETASFRVRFVGNREAGLGREAASGLAQALANAAEAHREAIFARWSGPAGGAWQPKCEITVHANAAEFARVTQQPAAATGRATINLDNGRVTARRIDLRADDATAAENALPRELTHVVLVDLFPTAAPPRWAVDGMAVLAGSSLELDRYRRTLPRLQQSRELMSVEMLLGLAAPPNDRVTGYYVGSVSLVDFLVRWKGDKAFTTFLRDSQRYGLPAALKRQYGVNDAKQLEEMWLRNAGTAARGQQP